jgi:cation diffusion facilitator family transporter
MGYLLRRVLVPGLPADSHENRTRLGILEGWVSTVVSLMLALVKVWLGLVSGSVSLLADATNNMADMACSLVVAFGFQLSRKPRDEEHPFGHGRIEAVATLVLSISLLVVGVEVAKSGLDRLLDPHPIHAPTWLLAIVGVTVVLKIWMAVFARRLARMSKSHVLEADAWNHFFDIVATLLVVLSLLGSRMGWVAMDGWTAIGVALFIFATGVKYAREAVDNLLGKKPDPKELDTIQKVVEAVEGVYGVHEVMVHQYGDVKMVSFHVEVSATLTVIEAHHIAEQAEDAVESRMEWRALAHVDPVDRSHPLFEELEQTLTRLVQVDPELVDFHDLRASGETQPYQISFDIVTSSGTHQDRYDMILARAISALTDKFSGRVDLAEIGIEAVVDSSPMMRRKVNIGMPAKK